MSELENTIKLFYDFLRKFSFIFNIGFFNLAQGERRYCGTKISVYFFSNRRDGPGSFNSRETIDGCVEKHIEMKFTLWPIEDANCILIEFCLSRKPSRWNRSTFKKDFSSYLWQSGTISFWLCTPSVRHLKLVCQRITIWLISGELSLFICTWLASVLCCQLLGEIATEGFTHSFEVATQANE